MSRIIISMLLLISLGSLSRIQKWYKLEDAGFSISFPSQPKIDSTDVESPIGKLTAYTYMLENDENTTDSNLIYGFSKSQYPEKYFQQAAGSEASFMKGVMDGFVNGAVKGVNGKLLTDKEVNLKGIPGREITVDYGNGTAIIRMILYLNKTKLFSIQTISYSGKENNSNAERFFKSLVIK